MSKKLFVALEPECVNLHSCLVLTFSGVADLSDLTDGLAADVLVLGQIPAGLPVPQWPIFPLEMLPTMAASALVLALLGGIDSLLTSLVADSLTGELTAGCMTDPLDLLLTPVDRTCNVTNT